MSLTTGAPASAHDEAQDWAASAIEPNTVLLSSLEALQNITDPEEFTRFSDELASAYPASPAVWKARVQRYLRDKSYEEAIELIDAFDVPSDHEPSCLITKAELLHDARAYERAGELFVELIDRFPQRRDLRTNYAKRLYSEGSLAKAYAILEPVRDCFPEGTKSFDLVEKTANLLALLTRLEGRPLREDEDARILAMKHAILYFRDREVRTCAESSLGRLSLITGSVGPGGAERQLTRLAVELERARREKGAIGSIELDRPVEVIVRSHGPEKQNDFYLADLVSAGVELSQINLFSALPTRELDIEEGLLTTLVDYLPPPVNFGVRRLTPHLRRSGTDTASIWQDGACLFAGLAALIAGVPQIQLAIRGLPPSMRRHMFRPEYEVLYRALSEVPGVTFLSNSLSAARAYAEWLDVPIDRFSIVYNGVEQMHADPSPDCAKTWDAFVEATPDATHTIGSVFRFDTDKQPLLWIRFAARYLKRHPNSRIVLVGGGRLLPNAQQLAEELGISGRILFVGRSTRVGYWMSKMDVLVLLSRYEGLPNVLIEAQYMGVRVVTTPAGGAAECLLDGTTGYVLECAEKPSLDGIVERAHSLALRSGDRTLFAVGELGRTFLDNNFSVPRMLQEYVACTAAGLHSVSIEDESEDHRRVA